MTDKELASMPPLMSAKSVADLTRLTVGTVRKLDKTNKVRAAKLRGRWVFDRDSLLRQLGLKSCKVRGTNLAEAFEMLQLNWNMDDLSFFDEQEIRALVMKALELDVITDAR